jgi:HNH endonuclease
LNVLQAEFESHIEPVPFAGCWYWVGANKGGHEPYGVFKKRLAHRVAYELYKGSLTPGLFVLHKCDMPSCVNPDHLYLGTQKQNIHDCIQRLRRGNISGENHPSHRLTLQDVANIRADRRAQETIAREYGITQSHVSHLKHGDSWRNGDKCIKVKECLLDAK